MSAVCWCESVCMYAIILRSHSKSRAYLTDRTSETQTYIYAHILYKKHILLCACIHKPEVFSLSLSYTHTSAETLLLTPPGYTVNWMFGTTHIQNICTNLKQISSLKRVQILCKWNVVCGGGEGKRNLTEKDQPCLIFRDIHTNVHGSLRVNKNYSWHYFTKQLL